MASSHLTVTFEMTEWPEAIHALRVELSRRLRESAFDVSPEAAAELNKIALEFEIMLDDIAGSE